MSLRKPPVVVDNTLTVRQKLALTHATNITNEKALQLGYEELSFEFFVSNGIKALQLQSAGLKPSKLKQLGVDSAGSLRQLGYDALHLVDPNFCVDVAAAYGATAVKKDFLVSASDAVAVAGTDAVATLDITSDYLLTLCAGAPVEAQSVFTQFPKPLEKLSCKVLLDTGLRAGQLKQMGVGLSQLKAMNPAPTKDEIKKLGFKL